MQAHCFSAHHATIHALQEKQCRRCFLIFPTMKEREEHFKDCKISQGMNCRHCDQKFTRCDRRNEHEDNCAGPGQFRCSCCEEQVFTSKVKHQAHKIECISKCVCRACNNKKFVKRRAFREHVRRHHPTAKCTVCDLVFLNEIDLTKHVLSGKCVTKTP